MRDHAAAEDLTADVFVAALAAYERAAPDADVVEPWLFRIARNKTVDHWRQVRRDRLLGGLVSRQRHAERSVESDATIRAELVQALEALQALKPRDRHIVGLRIGARLSFAAIGEIVGMSENSANVACQRAMDRVRKAVEESEDGP